MSQQPSAVRSADSALGGSVVGALGAPAQTLAWLRRAVACTALVLLAVTWRLWIPQSLYPQIPLLRSAGDLPFWVEWLGFGVLWMALLPILLAGQASRLWRGACLIFAAAVVGMVLIDQHRLQPWAYQFALVLFVLALATPAHGLALLRLLTISIYFHSAVSKIDASFVQSHGQTLVSGLLQNLGLTLEFLSTEERWWAAAMLPAGEMLIALGLCLPRLRRMAVAGAVLMHVLLLLALGPWGLGHRPAVLIWNVYFCIQAILLFGSRAYHTGGHANSRDDSDDSPWENRAEFERPPGAIGNVLATTAVGMAVILPGLEPFDRFDHWPAWAVYASRPERVGVYVQNSLRPQLPEDVQRHVAEPRPLDSWCRLDIDRWSLEALGVPIYPQGRFRLGVALAVADRFGMESGIQVIIQSPADRWTGERTTRELTGRPAIAEAAATDYWFNVVPRRIRRVQN